MTVETILVPITQQPEQSVVLVRLPLCLGFSSQQGPPLSGLSGVHCLSLCVAISWLMFRNTRKGQSGKKCRVPPPIRIIPSWMQSYYCEPDYSAMQSQDAIVYTHRTREVSLVERGRCRNGDRYWLCRGFGN